MHVCSTIGNIQQTDNFEYLWANLDGLKSEFDSSVDQFGIQTNRPNERFSLVYYMYIHFLNENRKVSEVGQIQMKDSQQPTFRRLRISQY